MNKIGMVVAVEGEVPKILSNFNYESVDSLIKYRLREDVELLMVISQPGRENVILSTEKLLTKFDVDYVLNIGASGGAYYNVKVGDIVIANKVRYKENVIDLNGELIRSAEQVLSLNKFNYHIGPVQVFDNFVFSKRHVYKDVFAVDMESYHIAEIASKFQKKTLVVRCISDVLSNRDPIFTNKFFMILKIRGFSKACLQLNNFFNNYFGLK